MSLEYGVGRPYQLLYMGQTLSTLVYGTDFINSCIWDRLYQLLYGRENDYGLNWKRTEDQHDGPAFGLRITYSHSLQMYEDVLGKVGVID